MTNVRGRVLKGLQVAVVLTNKEVQEVEIANFGLSEVKAQGLQLIVYVNLQRYCFKEPVLFFGQICPERRHLPVAGEAGKVETLHCRWSKVRRIVKGETTADLQALISEGSESYNTVFHEIELNPREQYIIPPDTPIDSNQRTRVR